MLATVTNIAHACILGLTAFNSRAATLGVSRLGVSNAHHLNSCAWCCLQCYLDSGADACGGPLCDRMAISIQGGLYGALLYADTENASELPPALETCIGDNPGSALRGVGGVKRSTKAPAKDGAAKTVPKTPKRVFPEVTLPGLTNRKYPNSNIPAQFLQYLLQSTCETLAGGCPSRSSAAAKAPGAVPKASRATPKAPTAKPPHAELAYARQPNTPLYQGCGIIISGPFYVTSKRKSKVEDTGMF